MGSNVEFKNFVVERLSAFGPITPKPMFGALAFYHQGSIIGMAIDDALYLKGDDQSKAQFEAEGLGQFTYGHKDGKQVAMSYWRAPERCLDDPDEMKRWCSLAYQAALRSKKPEKKLKKKL
ncbi:MAG: TfoX/Sxy family protein [Alphaproteobacteria bacterium]|nr:TfoX/Sxy family protein [Alphaproteobacteria bacterium]